jgi:hypothetical protein
MRAWMVFFAVIGVLFFFVPGFAQSDPSEQVLVPTLKQVDADALAGIRTDEEAKTFFLTRLRGALGLPNIQPDVGTGISTKAKTSQAQSATTFAEWTEIGGRLTNELAARQVAARLSQAGNDDVLPSLRAAVDRTHEQHQWLVAGHTRPELARAVQLAAVLADWSGSSPETTSASMLEPYDTYLDRTYPEFTGTDRSWLTLAEREGPAGIRERLAAFWNESQGAQLGVSASDKNAFALHYFHTRLRPVLLAQLTAAAIRAEVAADQQARLHWMALKSWLDKIREVKGLGRLCGTWQWTIHNHQHHQDQKVAMVFPPPDAGSFTGPRPAKTVVLGDAIYLRWEFPGVVQEDSLLFTGEGQRVEGSFVNSSGAWGSITGKRTAACAR